jgi:hypothetical protein
MIPLLHKIVVSKQTTRFSTHLCFHSRSNVSHSLYRLISGLLESQYTRLQQEILHLLIRIL